MSGPRGTVTIITGATGRLGRAVVHALAAAGGDLVLTGRNPGALDALVEEVCGGARVAAVAADLTETGAMERVVAEALRCFGTVDALINNAGVPGPVGPAWQVDETAWWHAAEVNLRGSLAGCRAVLPHMVARGRGRIVNIVSSAGHHRWPLMSAYSVSKAATIKLTENLARETSRHGVGVFAYHPGLLNGGMVHALDPRDAAAAPIVTWMRRQVRDGACTPLRTAVRTLTLLLDGTADPLSGRYLTADDDIPALAAPTRTRSTR